MRSSRGMGAVKASKMPKAKTITRKDNPDKVEMYAKGGNVKKYAGGDRVKKLPPSGEDSIGKKPQVTGAGGKAFVPDSRIKDAPRPTPRPRQPLDRYTDKFSTRVNGKLQTGIADPKTGETLMDAEPADWYTKDKWHGSKLGVPTEARGGKVYAKGGKLDIAKAIKKPGALRASLGTKKGETIPAKKLAKAAKAPGKLGQRARFAEMLKGFRKK
jgi:hypothetical protein